MNKETRKFIYGFFVFIVCSMGVAMNIVMIKEGVEPVWLHWLLLLVALIGVISGYITIKENI